MSPESHFLMGFYGRFYHGIFSLSTPWLHIRELLIAAGMLSIVTLLLCPSSCSFRQLQFKMEASFRDHVRYHFPRYKSDIWNVLFS